MTKTILAKTAVATVIMLCFALTSCEPDRHWRYSERDLYGKWYSTSTDGYYLTTITMYSDGLGYIEDWEGDYLVTRDRFEWEADRRYIYVYYYDYGIEERWRYRLGGYDMLNVVSPTDTATTSRTCSGLPSLIKQTFPNKQKKHTVCPEITTSPGKFVFNRLHRLAL